MWENLLKRLRPPKEKENEPSLEERAAEAFTLLSEAYKHGGKESQEPLRVYQRDFDIRQQPDETIFRIAYTVGNDTTVQYKWYIVLFTSDQHTNLKMPNLYKPIGYIALEAQKKHREDPASFFITSENGRCKVHKCILNNFHFQIKDALLAIPPYTIPTVDFSKENGYDVQDISVISGGKKEKEKKKVARRVDLISFRPVRDSF